MTYNRRLFLKSAGAAAAGSLVLTLAACGGSKEKSSEGTDSTGVASAGAGTPSIPDFGLQLYSVRDIIGADPKGVLKQIAGLGYKKLESYAGDKGFLWGLTPKEYKAYMDELGIVTVSTHADTTKDLEKAATEAKEAGLSYILQPYIGPQKTLDEWKKRAEEFNKRGEICNKVGIKFGYHNHDYSFKELEGKIPQEILLDGTDKSLVHYELDLMWIVAAKQDAAAHLKKYAGRYDLVHIKDLVSKPENHSTDLGKGEIDFASLLKVASDSGVTQFIVEQEEYPGPVLTSIGNDAEYMKKLVFKS
ncbi:sugar phosphate isomerase/epimerase family protein [Dyadobacter subterraneus]|uniref:Sugar phosphate isomerase/epimerase n=1 Tax=Dyadobacter subterraneus TaxID=2773304 RepID=A0ABR9WCB5_9BACT|nr:sugar phosphate isomerase/epimerase [Dyadobacter subterraneus]MBE9463102.1 sugar phosphate isomerase/epimerase [Dyadobacter subterraneus]